jgi:anti-sigma-K factor RskA
MTHSEMDELYDLYALGALEPGVATEIESHLADGCTYCRGHLQAGLELSAALAGMAEPVMPPSGLRKRVMASVAPRMRPSRNWTVAIAGLSAACLALLAWSLWSGVQMSQLSSQVASLTTDRDQLRTALEVMARSGTRTVQFGNRDNVPHGRVFVNPKGGLVFVGSRLPQLAANQTFELWVVPRSGAPKPAGLFRPNGFGDSVHISTEAVDPSQAQAVAVSVEPLKGSSVPTRIILVVSLA